MRRKGEHEGEHEEDINRGDDLGLYGDAVRLQLLRRSTTGRAYCQHSDSDSDSDSDANSHADADADPNSNSSSYSYSYSYSYSDADADSYAYANSHADASSGACSGTWNERYAESCHSGRSGSLDDRSEPDAHQSRARDRAEHRQRPVYRRIRQLPTGRCGLPDGRWISHDLDTFYRGIQYDTGSV